MDRVIDAANSLINLANAVHSDDPAFIEFKKMALLVADDYVEDINTGFLTLKPDEWPHDFAEQEDGSWKLNDVSYDFSIHQNDFGLWETNITLAGVTVVLQTKVQLISTVEWLADLVDDEDEKNDEDLTTTGEGE